MTCPKRWRGGHPWGPAALWAAEGGPKRGSCTSRSGSHASGRSSHARYGEHQPFDRNVGRQGAHQPSSITCHVVTGPGPEKWAMSLVIPCIHARRSPWSCSTTVPHTHRAAARPSQSIRSSVLLSIDCTLALTVLRPALSSYARIPDRRSNSGLSMLCRCSIAAAAAALLLLRSRVRSSARASSVCHHGPHGFVTSDRTVNLRRALSTALLC
jgi:hypothetical protein